MHTRARCYMDGNVPCARRSRGRETRLAKRGVTVCAREALWRARRLSAVWPRRQCDAHCIASGASESDVGGPGAGTGRGGWRKTVAGRAGKTLFRWLERAGIDEETFRRRVYIAAVTRCYPGPSPSGRGDRVPSPAEQDKCSVWLDAELQLIRPTLVIPVGRLAITKFLPNVPLDQLIGRIHSSTRTEDARDSAATSVGREQRLVHEGNHPQLLDTARCG